MAHVASHAAEPYSAECPALGTMIFVQFVTVRRSPGVHVSPALAMSSGTRADLVTSIALQTMRLLETVSVPSGPGQLVGGIVQDM